MRRLYIYLLVCFPGLSITGCETATVTGGEDDGEWRFEIVDNSANVGKTPSLVLNDDGCPFVSYYGITAQDLRYSRRTNGCWTSGHLDGMGLTFSTAIQLDESGLPLIAYVSNDALKYLSWGSAGWAIETVDSQGSVGLYTSMVLDSDGYPHIAYQDYSDFDAKYAWKTAEGWQCETIDSGSIVGLCNSIVLDSADRPIIAYYDRGNRLVRLAVKDGDDWTLDSVDDGGYCSLAIDDADTLHLAYWGLPEHELRYAVNDGSGWAVSVVDDTLGTYGIDIDIALAPDGNPHIAYIDTDLGVLKYAHVGTKGWSIRTIDNESMLDYDVEIAIDDDYGVHIVYRADGILKYAVRE